MTAPASDGLQAAADCYGMIIDDVAVIAVSHHMESELGCAALATGSLLAPRPTEPLRRDRNDQRLEAFAGLGTASEFRPAQHSPVPHERLLALAPTVLHEGFMTSPQAEGDAEIERVRSVVGERFWASPAAVWDSWGDKARFRERCAGLLGEDSLPPGAVCSTNDVDDVVSRLDHLDSPGRTIVKLPGTGGEANVVLTPTGDDGWQDALRELWHEQAAGLAAPVDVVIEQWLPWERSYSVSFLMVPGHPAAFVAICEQMVDPVTSAFVGSRSRGPAEADRAAILGHLGPVFDALSGDGFAGIAALDVIVGPAAAWGGRGLALPTGSRLSVIECNPRFNLHNRVGMIVERLARHWDVPSPSLSWTFRVVPVPDGSSLPELLAALNDPGTDLPPLPRPGEPARLVFTHRSERAMELAVRLDHDG